MLFRGEIFDINEVRKSLTSDQSNIMEKLRKFQAFSSGENLKGGSLSKFSRSAYI